MSYQVLARKWRPRSFREMVGQEHVLRALVNALDHDRLHHAYLFTGTRGVGKTTIARIFAKCLNCEQGVSSEPCGECGACSEIAEGRSVDLLEVDAASRTKVEDTRELLENVQYAPTNSRYKVYLIDEVHMLSASSFNALLKTLEEPPPHVKFLLATTDPQKLPATVLSRCLQFNLKNMPPEQIVGHLGTILDKEMISFEEPALWLLARAAAGSMRDALSLTDQAIAFGSGKLLEAEVRSMLGSVDLGLIHEILASVASGETAAVLASVARMAEYGADFDNSVDELISLLHRVALAQALPESADNSFGDAEQVLALAAASSAEDAQLFYQIAINGKRDMALAPEPRTGFEMLLLRMLAFRPADAKGSPTPGGAPRPSAEPGNGNPAGQLRVALGGGGESAKKPPEAAPEAVAGTAFPEPLVAQPAVSAPATRATVAPAPQRAAESPAPATGRLTTPGEWVALHERLGLVGVVQSVASNMALASVTDTHFRFVLDREHSALFNDSHEAKLRLALQNYFDRELAVTVEIGEPPADTPAMLRARKLAERQALAVQEIEQDQRLQALMVRFDGRLDPASITPLDS